MSDPLDEVYRAPFGEFVARRKEVAARLRAEGDRETAKAVAGARKPTVAAWAVNQLPEEAPDELDELRALHADVTGGGHELHELLERRRRVVGQLTAAAARVLQSDGRSPATFERDVQATLEAAVVDPEALDAVTAGHLTAPLSAPGLEALAATPVAERKGARSSRAAAERRQAERNERERKAAQERLVRAEERVADARRRLAEVERARDEAADALDAL